MIDTARALGAAPEPGRRVKTYDTDILIVGSGITAALMAARLAETTTRRITVVEAPPALAAGVA